MILTCFTYYPRPTANPFQNFIAYTFLSYLKSLPNLSVFLLVRKVFILLAWLIDVIVQMHYYTQKLLRNLRYTQTVSTFPILHA